MFGAIVGAVLGCTLISLVGYFLCGKRKSDAFGHQRLYDDTRNDPGNEPPNPVKILLLYELCFIAIALRET